MALGDDQMPDEPSSPVPDRIGHHAIVPTARSPLPRLAVASTIGAVVTTLTTFLPWATSGARTRSSYEVVDVAVRAGVLSEANEALSVLWYVVPVLCGLVLVAAALRSVVLVSVTAGTIGAIAVAGGWLVARSPLGVEPGLILAVGVGAATAGTGIGTLITTKRRTT
ncbi:hypothetical protein [Actinospongicola halichondriae]|uniref:hypothetical protein n=1 Tax=Actinospongicola halichondriae TaxID=3236844 RepID=UPI003D503466